MLDADDLPTTVDVRRPQARGLGRPQAGGVGRGQGRTVLQARNSFQKAHHFVRAQDHRQAARLAGVRNPLGQLRPVHRHAVEEAQGADDLVQRRPGHARSHQVHLERTHIFQAQPIWRTAEKPAELRDRMDVRSLGRRRQIADSHVLDHAAAQRARFSHLGFSCLRGWLGHQILSGRGIPAPVRSATTASAV